MAQPIAISLKSNILTHNELEPSDSCEIDEFLTSLRVYQQSLKEMEQCLDRSDKALKDLTECMGLTYNEEAFKVQTVISKQWGFPELRKQMTEVDGHLIRAEDIANELAEDISHKCQASSRETTLCCVSSWSEDEGVSVLVRRRSSFKKDII